MRTRVDVAVPKGHLRIGPLMAIPRILRERRVDPAKILGACKLDAELFEDPENTLPFAKGSHLLELCVARTGIPHFGLVVAQTAHAESMGTVGYLMLSSPNVGVALESLVAHFNLHDRSAIVTLRRDAVHATLGYALLEPGPRSTDQVYALSIAMGHNILRALCGPRWRAASVALPFRRPPDIAPYRAAFGITPMFDAAEAALVFPVRQLELPLPSADAFLNRLMRDRAAKAPIARDGDLVDEVRHLLRGRVSVSKGTIADVAASLGITERTLSRQLAAYGTSFRAIRDEVWHDVAKELLSHSRAAVGEIAMALGYADPAAFTRAFMRWSGTTPARWRRDRRGAR